MLTIYELAYHLKMPVYKLSAEMPYEELLMWIAYFEKRPVDWRADSRTFKLLQAQGVKAAASEVFPSLQALAQTPVEESENIGKKVVNSPMFALLASAKGGEALPQ
jgi:hypothetical protein